MNNNDKHGNKAKTWLDVNEHYKFNDKDGSYVTRVHPIYEAPCYCIQTEKDKRDVILSSDHLLLINISKLSKVTKKFVKDNFTGYLIPTILERHAYYKDLGDILERQTMTQAEINWIFNHLGLYRDKSGHTFLADHKEQLEYNYNNCLDKKNNEISKDIRDKFTPEIVEDYVKSADFSNVSENEYWLPVSLIFDLINKKEEILAVVKKDTKETSKIIKCEYAGVKPVRCVETSTHSFEICGLVHHNSVTLRNVILHCLTHQESIAIALVDLKQTEFEAYKGLKGVVAVANSVREAVEILRIQRECMYARNKEMAKLGLNDIKDFKPKEPTDETMIFNWKFKNTDKVQIKTVDGEIKEVTVDELEAYLV